jgi:hypothetical protein
MATSRGGFYVFTWQAADGTQQARAVRSEHRDAGARIVTREAAGYNPSCEHVMDEELDALRGKCVLLVLNPEGK